MSRCFLCVGKSVCIPKSEKCGEFSEFRQMFVNLVGGPGDP